MNNTALIWIVTALYGMQAAINAWNGHNAQGLILTGYSLANLGLIWSMRS